MNLFSLTNVNKLKIEKELQSIINDIELKPEYQEILNKQIFSGGKRLRPIFTIVGSRLGPNPHQDIYKIAAIMELIHTASLIHDDIIDNAELRRGVPSINKIYDQKTACMLGDYIIARCLEIVNEIEVGDIVYHNLDIRQLCLSEMMQQSLLFNYDVTLKEYLKKTEDKTALLIASSFALGATISGATDENVKLIYNFGINLGISFQIIDDILDFTKDSTQLGKLAGADLREGNITLPVIYALKDKSIKNTILKLNNNSSDEQFDEVIESIRNSDAIDKSFKLSDKYLSKAKNIISKLPIEHHEILLSLVKTMEQRSY